MSCMQCSNKYSNQPGLYPWKKLQPSFASVSVSGPDPSTAADSFQWHRLSLPGATASAPRESEGSWALYYHHELAEKYYRNEGD